MKRQVARRAEAVLGDGQLARVTLRLRQLAMPAVRLLAGPSVPDDEVPVGASKLGGRPDLPSGMAWPRKGPPVERPLPIPFIGQVRLSEIAPHDIQGALPHHGLLFFFFDDACTDGSHQAYLRNFGHPAHCRVLWSDEPLDRLEQLDPPPDLVEPPPGTAPLGVIWPEGGLYGTVGLTPDSEMSLPDPESPHLADPDGQSALMSEEEWEAYAGLWEEHMDWNKRVHQLLGHAAPNQAAAVWAGYREARRAFFAPDEEIPASLANELTRHRLLLQVSPEANGMWFGREGRLCLFVHEDDLAARDFSRVWWAA